MKWQLFWHWESERAASEYKSSIDLQVKGMVINHKHIILFSLPRCSGAMSNFTYLVLHLT